MWTLIKYFSTNVYFMVWAGSAVLFFLSCRRNRKIVITGAVVFAVAWIIATRPFGELFVLPLENMYAPPNMEELREAGVYEVLVQTGGGSDHQEGWLYSRSLTLGTTMRMMAGLEIAAELGPDAKLIYSGAGYGIPIARYMADITYKLQPDRVVVVDTLAGRTVDHPQTAGPLIEGERFVLVTSAYHIPRSVKVFRDAGYDPIPFPADYQYSRGYKATDYFPSAAGLIKVQIVLYELWAYLVYLTER